MAMSSSKLAELSYDIQCVAGHEYDDIVGRLIAYILASPILSSYCSKVTLC